MADASPSTIAAFQTGNHSVICYFSAGSREEYRGDAGDFPQEAVGKVMAGWEQERWVDTRSEGVREVMRRRIEEAAGKGCGGVDADNIDGYSNDSGFDLTADDAVDFVRFLAHTTHEAGMAFGLKNGGDIVERVVDVVEWCVQEECVRYGECGLYRAVIEAGKPVFHIEYVDGGGEGKSHDDGDEEKFVEEACKGEGTEGFSTLVKKLSLDGWTRTCSAP
ncbi:related to endo alpha-1,4 polygalactosaminidase precusor [Ramularia collo-cygni]|uniref:alpha-galactosidase n=1 Tax=Ramularia collo-cygni TaxID=112498 RepID=A0A2D3ULW6_9PEZI|nr:related to endo alpha-1,4 polygalactosaminidase precusor [Ramularia collo-cygni]CZT15642.1 related to endo alpha-1,4 polygalactosaminidase precusor [Ramularia collo-cygni]